MQPLNTPESWDRFIADTCAADQGYALEAAIASGVPMADLLAAQADRLGISGQKVA